MISVDARALRAVTARFEKFTDGIGIDTKVGHVQKTMLLGTTRVLRLYPGERNCGSLNNCFLFVSKVTSEATTINFKMLNINQ